MKVIPLIPRGYCKGVVNAISIAKKCATDYPNTPITVLGMIVHNEYVVRALEHLNIKTLEAKGKTRLELLEEVDEGVVLFTAHGISDEVIQKAKEKGLICVDASCTDVIFTKKQVQNRIQDGYHVLYIGKKGHPEAEAIVSSSKEVSLIDSIESIDKLSLNHDKLYLTNQTTMSILEIAMLIEHVKEKYPHCVVEEEVCNATRMRQEAVLNLEHADLLYVVGDPHSNNSTKLKSIALSKGIKQVELIETCQDIELEHLSGVETVAITAGASTPTYLTNQVIEVLNHYAATNELLLPEIELSKIL